MENTNPEKKSLSELIKAVGDGKVIIIDDSFIAAKHIDLIEKMKLKHEVLLVHMDDLLIEDSTRLKEHILVENNKKAFSGGGIEELIRESSERLIKELKMIETEIPFNTKEKPVLPEKSHDYGVRKQNCNQYKSLPKKVLGFRGKR